MFDLDQLSPIVPTRAADGSSKTIREVVRWAVSDPTGLLKAFGEPDRAHRRAGAEPAVRKSMRVSH
jgi:hypothetical protein